MLSYSVSILCLTGVGLAAAFFWFSLLSPWQSRQFSDELYVLHLASSIQSSGVADSCYVYNFAETILFNGSIDISDLYCAVDYIEISDISVDSPHTLDTNSMSNSSTCLQVATQSWLTFHMQAYDQTGEKCSQGGADMVIFARGQKVGTVAYAQGHVIDHFNGSYTAFYFTGEDAGVYHITIQLDFNKFEGSFMCDTRRYELGTTTEIELKSMFSTCVHVHHHQQTTAFKNSDHTKHIKTEEYIKQHNNNIKSPGRWLITNTITNTISNIIANANSTPTDVDLPDHLDTTNVMMKQLNGSQVGNLLRLLSGSLQWVPYHHHQQQPSDKLFPLDKLKSKWIHFIGKSRTLGFFEDLCKVITMQKVDSTVQPIYKVANSWHPSRSVEGAGNFVLHVRFFQELNILVTYSQHDRDFKNNELDFNKTLEDIFSFNNLSRSIFLDQHGFDIVPDMIVINKGLHLAHEMSYDLFNKTLNDYKNFINGHFRCFQNLLTSQKSEKHKKKFVFWRLTSSAHFWEQHLPQAWMCRTQSHIECLNTVATSVISEYLDQYNERSDGVSFHVLDEWHMSLGRSDCTPDNRHYILQNCGQTFVNRFLNDLDRL